MSGLTVEEFNSLAAGSPSRSALRQQLRDLGFEYVGSGFFSSVLAQKGSDTVVKLAACIPEHGVDGWLAWAYYSLLNPAPWAAPVLAIHEFPNPNGEYAALMRRLDRTLSQAENSGENYPFSTARNIAEAAYRGFHGQSCPEGELETQVYHYMRDFAESGGNAWSSDMHNGNFMFDRDGTIVITDPLSFVKQLTDDGTRIPPAIHTRVLDRLRAKTRTLTSRTFNHYCGA